MNYTTNDFSDSTVAPTNTNVGKKVGRRVKRPAVKKTEPSPGETANFA